MNCRKDYHLIIKKSWGYFLPCSDHVLNKGYIQLYLEIRRWCKSKNFKILYVSLYISYPVVTMYPVIGASKFLLDWVHDNVTDLEVNLVTIGLPGGSGTSETKNKNIFLYLLLLTSQVEVSSYTAHYELQRRKCYMFIVQYIF